jgi:enoyl-CoA hydratase/carnithine racemase
VTTPRVTISLDAGVADVRLARPEKMNALDPPMFEGIRAAISKLAVTPGLRAVVLSGEGKAFCAGLDLGSMGGGIDVGDIRARTYGHANDYQQVAWGWRMLAVPVIAAAHGVVFGGGLQIFSGADIRLAAPGTRFSVMEMKWGIIPDMGGIALWRGSVRDDVLRELTFTARELQSDEALRLGFVTRIADDPLSDALALARTIADRNPHAVRAAKRLLNAMADEDAATILRAESDEQAKLLFQPNQLEAVAANMQKRKPEFSD